MELLAQTESELTTFERRESEVRSYCRGFPTLFTKASGYTLQNAEGKTYLDFFAGAGALNYGHNHPALKKRLIQYIQEDGIAHSLDMATAAKKELLEAFEDVILKPRRMDYKVMFPGPTGTNAVEAALKLARKVTGRQTVVSFTNGFHGMTLGALSVTGNGFKRGGAGVPLTHAVSMPFDGYFGQDVNTLDYLDRYLADGGSGMELPAAVIVETVQGEGGLNAASDEWLRGLEAICRGYGILLIVDDIQVGCGRTGAFFSFESAGIRPDIVTLSKSIGGYGLPLALTLMKPELDCWSPGEHNGTFRGNNLAFVTAAAALRQFWSDGAFEKATARKSERIRSFLAGLIDRYPQLGGKLRGRGMIQGIACEEAELASDICKEAFARGVIMETSGPSDEVFKLLPPLIMDDDGFREGFSRIEEAVAAAVRKRKGAVKS
ncbi:diaminobutyrate--2-oxoglutarate transaminase [Paenibacillus sp.]|uniref:diaminobutyrate--2-oxoglutarate transaminase n=1 Tax=Paenibacillus sp. TaxID=58172 RepID=UPI002D5C0A5F|nr:diaminobutyrate--2-oxoglutarate transaminase [Paenibacillus sp.]HZG87614.1 diaminobutyrate--2-oxoglutarate transaminase [Paenibacillus sp.]